MKIETKQIIISKEYLNDKIYVIRGKRIMLDHDLAEIYGYSTKRFNEQVKNNKAKFEGEDFMFKLNKNEIPESLRLKYIQSNKNNSKRGHNIKFLPYAFTESGIYMLMTVLKGELATRQSRTLIRLFKSMKDYIQENSDLLSNKELELRTLILEKDIVDINSHLDDVDITLNKVMSNFIDPSVYKHILILDGKKFDADIAYRKIVKQAKYSIIYIDDYICIKTLDLLSYALNDIHVTIISDNKASPPLKQTLVNDFISQNKNIELTLLESNNKCHDRYIVIDFNTNSEKIYHCGASCKDAGNKVSTITNIEAIELYKPLIKSLLKMPKLKLL